MSADEPTTEELKAVQIAREHTERELAEDAGEAGDEREERTHERRADRAEYLKEKLDEQAEALGE